MENCLELETTTLTCVAGYEGETVAVAEDTENLYGGTFELIVNWGDDHGEDNISARIIDLKGVWGGPGCLDSCIRTAGIHESTAAGRDRRAGRKAGWRRRPMVAGGVSLAPARSLRLGLRISGTWRRRVGSPGRCRSKPLWSEFRHLRY